MSDEPTQPVEEVVEAVKDAASGAGEAPKSEVRTEEVKVTGDALVSKLKELLHEGNIRRVIIKNEEGKTLIEIPLTIGVAGVLLLPAWAAVGAIAALVAKLTIVVEKVE